MKQEAQLNADEPARRV